MKSVLEVQKRLIELGYSLPKFGADGFMGAETITALQHFQMDAHLPITGVVDSPTEAALFAVASVKSFDRAKFFAAIKKSLFGGKLTTQVTGIDAILNEWEAGKYTDDRWLAYILATPHLETGASFEPIHENLNYSAKRLMEVWPSRFPTLAAATPYANNPEKLANKVYGGRMGNTAPDDGWRYRGRALVQLTGKDNYKKFGLEGNPDAANDIPTAARILVSGMVKGLFTGLKLSTYFDADSNDAIGARKIINPDSNGAKVAGYYVKYLAAIRGQ